MINIKVIFENKYKFTEEQINIPFIVGETVIGVVYEVNKNTFTVQIFDKFIGLEVCDKNVNAIYLSEKEQISFDEFIKGRRMTDSESKIFHGWTDINIDEEEINNVLKSFILESK